LEANAILHLAIGADIDRWRDRPGVIVLARADGRTRLQRAIFRARRADGIATLRRTGHADLVADFRDNTWAVPADARFPASVRLDANDMIHIGDRAVVFVLPFPGT
jgi:hypothetical protein